MKKRKVLYFMQLQKFETIKWSYFSPFWPLGRDIEEKCILPNMTYIWHIWLKSPESEISVS